MVFDRAMNLICKSIKLKQRDEFQDPDYEFVFESKNPKVKLVLESSDADFGIGDELKIELRKIQRPRQAILELGNGSEMEDGK